MYLPLDDARLDTVLRNGVIPYLTSGETIAVREEAYAPKNATVKPSVPPKRQEAPAPEKRRADASRASRECRGNHFQNRKYSSRERQPCCGERQSKFRICKILRLCFTRLFRVLHIYTACRGQGRLQCHRLHRTDGKNSAKELASADFGACISDICNTDGCSYICIAVAGESSAIVRKLYREPDEKDESFIRDAAEELIELIGEKASGESSVGIEISGEAAAEPEAEKSSRQREKSPCFNTCNNSRSCRCGRHIFPCEISKRQKMPPRRSQTPRPKRLPRKRPFPRKYPRIRFRSLFLCAMKRLTELTRTTLRERPRTPQAPLLRVTMRQTKSALPEYIVLNGVKPEAKMALAKSCGRGCGRQLQFRSH